MNNHRVGEPWRVARQVDRLIHLKKRFSYLEKTCCGSFPPTDSLRLFWKLLNNPRGFGSLSMFTTLGVPLLGATTERFAPSPNKRSQGPGELLSSFECPSGIFRGTLEKWIIQVLFTFRCNIYIV